MDDGTFNLLVDLYNKKENDSIQKLQDKESELNIYRLQLENIRNQLQEEKNSKNELNRKLTIYKNKSLNQTARINSLQNEINNMRNKNKHNNDKIISLLEEIKIKDDNLKKLNSIIKVTKSNDKLNEPITICFTSSLINENIVCHYNDIFSQVAGKLFQKYPSLNPDNVYFLYNGTIIKNDQSVLWNEIADKEKVLIVQNN